MNLNQILKLDNCLFCNKQLLGVYTKFCNNFKCDSLFSFSVKEFHYSFKLKSNSDQHIYTLEVCENYFSIISWKNLKLIKINNVLPEFNNKLELFSYIDSLYKNNIILL